MTDANPEIKLRWYQFRLRTLLIFVFLVACVCSLISISLRRAWPQYQAVREIVITGGHVDYGLPVVDYVSDVPPPMDVSWSQLFKRDYLHDVVGVSNFTADKNKLAYLDALPKLKHLELKLIGGCKNGLKHLESLPSLEALSISGDDLEDDSLVCLEKLTHLTGLYLSGEKLTDKCLVHLQPLQSLEGLYLHAGQWSGEGLKSLTSLKNLKTLVLTNKNCCNDETLAYMEYMPKLETFSALESQSITNAGLEHINKWHYLTELYLGGAQIDDEGLSCLSNMHSLKSLGFLKTNVTGSGLGALSEIKTLRSLYLNASKLDDEGMQHLSKLSQIECLNLDETNITDKGLQQLVAMKQLKYLFLNKTKITLAGLKKLVGELPPGITIELRNTPAATMLNATRDAGKDFPGIELIYQ